MIELLTNTPEIKRRRGKKGIITLNKQKCVKIRDNLLVPIKAEVEARECSFNSFMNDVLEDFFNRQNNAHTNTKH